MKLFNKKCFAIIVSLVMMITLFTPSFANADSKPELKVTLDKTEVNPGDEVNATVTLNTNGVNNIDGIQAKVNFNKDVVEIQGDPVKKLPAQTEMDICAVNANQEEGFVQMVFTAVLDNGLDYNGELFTFKFKVNENATVGNYTLTFDESNGSPLQNGNNNTDVETTITNANFDVVKHLKGISFEGNKTSAQLNVGQTDTLTVVYDPNDTTDNKTVTWSTTNENVVSVSNGTVTAVGPGSATVKAKVGEKTATCTYTIKAPLTGIELNNGSDELSLVKGQNKTIAVKYNPENTTDSKTVTWSSSDETIATVDANGKVTAKKAGTTTITAVSTLSDEITDSVTITVTEIPINSIAFEQADDTMLRWDEMQLTVIYNPENTTDDKVVTWESSDEDIAVVDENGLVTALKAGNVTIKATTANGKIAEKEITVEEKHLEKIDASDTKTDVTVGDQVEIVCVANPEDFTDEIMDIQFESSDEDVVSVSEFGIYTAKKVGKATIKITVSTEYDEFTDEIEVEVKEKEVATEENTSEDSDSTKTSSPQTGDLPIVGIVATSIVSLAGAVVVAKKKLLN